MSLKIVRLPTRKDPMKEEVTPPLTGYSSPLTLLALAQVNRTLALKIIKVPMFSLYGMIKQVKTPTIALALTFFMLIVKLLTMDRNISNTTTRTLKEIGQGRDMDRK